MKRKRSYGKLSGIIADEGGIDGGVIVALDGCLVARLAQHELESVVVCREHLLILNRGFKTEWSQKKKTRKEEEERGRRGGYWVMISV